MIYTTLFLIGLLGLVALVLLGAGHIGGHGHAIGHGHGGGHGHTGHGHGGPHGNSHGHGSSQGRAGRDVDLHVERGQGLSPLLGLLSPLVLFSVCVGIGATGLLLRPLHWMAWLTAGAALAGGIAFYRMAVKPVWGMIFAFASNPSKALEGAVASQAEAMTRFDAAGKGIVKLHLDGQVVRLLAVLEPDDQSQAVAVVPGEKLIVTGVDGHANTCRVARME